ncbi:MAG: hypothetical protein JWR37_3326, partial [Mycobacterium sp.]|nr:hypothetical protein [Mycobacterium sp.]
MKAKRPAPERAAGQRRRGSAKPDRAA